jgi:hypothetical protein
MMILVFIGFGLYKFNISNNIFFVIVGVVTNNITDLTNVLVTTPTRAEMLTTTPHGHKQFVLKNLIFK